MDNLMEIIVKHYWLIAPVVIGGLIVNYFSTKMKNRSKQNSVKIGNKNKNISINQSNNDEHKTMNVSKAKIGDNLHSLGYILEAFKQYLKEQGFSEYTPSGLPSTVYAYLKSLEKIAFRESVSVGDLFKNIGKYVERYDTGGDEAEFGRKSHRTYIAALKKFKDFKELQ